MSSPITFSGFNNIDFSVVLNSLMQQASVPLTALQTNQSNLKSQSSNLTTLASHVADLSSAADALGQSSSLTAFSATSTDASAVSATTNAGAVAGHYDVVVQELARAQVTASASTAADANTTVVASGGSLTIGGVQVDVTGDSTLQQLASTINSTAGIGVAASVVRAGAGSYRLVLTGRTTGSDGAFTIANNLGGGAGVSFTDTDGDNLSGNSAADNAVSATDAQLLVNNVAIVSTTNTITDAVPGVTLALTRKDPNTTVGVDVSPDDSTLQTQVTSFITAYNSLVQFANSQAATAASGDATSIGRNPLLRGLRNQLRSLIGDAYSGGAFDRLSQVGIEFTQTGTLQLNTAQFADAVANHANDVTQIFAGANGAFPKISGVLKDYSQADGLLASAQTQITAQSAALDRQISAMQDRLAVQRTSLQAEFSAADAAMSALQSQSSALTNFSASLNGTTNS